MDIKPAGLLGLPGVDHIGFTVPDGPTFEERLDSTS
jgi:hypothetical protein